MTLNRYSLWQYISIACILGIATLYAIPNLYGEDPAVQVTARASQIGEGELNRVKDLLKQEGLTIKSAAIDENQILVRFETSDAQLLAADRLQELLGTGYTVALNLAPTTPEWLRRINASPMYLGLDLRGGVHFLMEVDMDTAVKQSLENFSESIKLYMRENNLYYRAVALTGTGNQVLIRFKDALTQEQVLAKLQGEYPELDLKGDQAAGDPAIVISMKPQTIQAERKNAVSQNIITLRNRINELGVSEPIIQQQGPDRIVVQLPGVQDTTKAKRILGATATLEYRLVHGSPSDWSAAQQAGHVPINTKLYKQRDGSPVLLKRAVIATGDSITNATVGFDSSNNLPAVVVTLDGKGGDQMSKISGENIGNPMAVVFIENKTESKIVDGKSVITTRKVEEVISIATIRDQLGRRFQTTGLSQTEAKDLALLLRAGALKAPMQIIEERTVGPSLGKDNIEKGFNSAVIGLGLITLFMVLYYRMFGIFSGIALLANVVMLIAVLSMLQATLTVPGIAGIVLTIGMAVDANVLINERIREELRNGNSIQASIHAGYEKAFSTIADSNITTLIAGLVLFGVGSGSIKGFAITLSIGILTSMFTAVVVTRAIANLLYGTRNIKKLSI